jgi:hypothetical protein
LGLGRYTSAECCGCAFCYLAVGELPEGLKLWWGLLVPCLPLVWFVAPDVRFWGAKRTLTNRCLPISIYEYPPKVDAPFQFKNE